jgi:hypothetical protein
MRALPLLFSLALGAAIAGCWYDTTTSRRTPAPANTTGTGTTTPPPRLSIDTGRTLFASPGQGVGLFITYSSGGKWKLEWSCDSAVSRAHSCNFEIAIGTNGFTELASVPTNAVIARDAQSFNLRTVTTTTLDSATFQTEPGAAIGVTMRVDGQVFPKLMFFVSGGQLSTAPSDPFELVPTDP